MSFLFMTYIYVLPIFIKYQPWNPNINKDEII